MGRFSPSVSPGPSWTQGLSEGIQNIGQQLMQRRAFNQQKLQQDREFALQQQGQDVRNAEAGYTPAGLSTATPEGLNAISNAGIANANQPASYDPTKSLTYALMNGRNMAAMDRTQAQIGGREDVQQLRNEGQANNIGLRYGTYGLDGQPLTMGAQTGSKLQTQAPVLDQRNDQFQQREGDRAASLAEQIRYHTGMINKPTGGSRMSIGGGGPTPTAQMGAYNQEMRYLTHPHQEPIKDPKNPNGPSILSGMVDGLGYDSANTIATKHAQDRAKLFGQPQPGQNLAPKASGDVPTTPPVQGNVKTLRGGQVTDQHTVNAGSTIPSGPTASNTPDYSTAAKHYQEAEAAIKASAAPDKLQRLATLRARYNADVAKIGSAPK